MQQREARKELDYFVKMACSLPFIFLSRDVLPFRLNITMKRNQRILSLNSRNILKAINYLLIYL